MRKGILPFLTAYLLCVEIQAQHPFFQSYSLLRKNEPVQVNAIKQDRNGFMWFGTDRGLFRFDGADLSRFSLADSLPDDHVTAIEEDSTGRLWLGHRNGMLSVLDGRKITRFDPPEGPAAGEVSDILFDRKGNLWFSTLNDGLYYYTNNRLFRLDENEGMPDLFVYEMTEDDQGLIWAGTDGGLVSCKLDGQKATLKTITSKDGLPDNIVKAVGIHRGKIWFGTEDNGVFSLDLATSLFAPLTKNTWSHGSVADFQFKGDEVWISGAQAGLVRVDEETQELEVVSAGEGMSSSRGLHIDNEGNIWIATKTGVLRTPGSAVEILNQLGATVDPNVVALAVDKGNNIWFSTHDGLFVTSTDANGHVSSHQFPLASQFVQSGIISLHGDEAGNIWAGLYGAGVLIINPATKQVKQISKELRNGSVLNITSKGDVVWLATLGGATRIRNVNDHLEVRNYSQQDGLVSDYIYQVFIDSGGRVWLATDRSGIDMLDGSGFHHYKEGLNSKVVYGFVESVRTVWANVQGEGLYRLEGQKFIPALTRQLRDQNVSVLSTDAAGKLIIGHDLGIDVYNQRDSSVFSLGETAGIQNMHPNLNAVAQNSHGDIFIGTDKGIILFKPHRISTQAPKPKIEEMRVNDENVALTDAGGLSYDQNTVAFNYVGFWYQNPASLTYQYRLEGHDRDWITSRDRSVIYSSLGPGHYTFHLRVSDTGEFEGAAEVSTAFLIRPPFWKTIWFYAITLVVIGFGIYSFILTRERRLRMEKQVLETTVAERTREIRAMNDEILAQNEEIQSQSDEIKSINEHLEELVKSRTWELEQKNIALEEYAFINAHKLRAPVASILGLINLIHKTELDAESRQIVDHLRTSAKSLDEVVTTITEAIERGSMDLPG